MAPLRTQGGRVGDSQPGGSRISENVARSDAASQHRRNDESWVEISSQPSSSSLSSIGDEIVTTGLQVGAGASSYPPRRRRLHPPQRPMPTSYIVSHSAAQAGTSSQEEYDESESEEDKLMTSSAEHRRRPGQGQGQSLQQQSALTTNTIVESDTDDDDDEDDRGTALGRRPQSPTFRPQPNAFSHPPSHLTHRHSTPTTSSPHHYPQLNYHRQSFSGRTHTRNTHSPNNFMSPSYQADNDAALRASLTTLLSCAAAARGLPKSSKDTNGLTSPSSGGIGGVGAGIAPPSSQPMELRLVPESELMSEAPSPRTKPAAAVSVGRRAVSSNSGAPNSPSSAATATSSKGGADKGKRTASSASQAKPARATKKKKTTATAMEGGEAAVAALISPTLMTWVVSAGVVVLVSVVGFGAGYVIGREVGRQEASFGIGGGAAGSGANATSSCGRELIRPSGGGTLRRFRWGAGMGRSVAA